MKMAVKAALACLVSSSVITAFAGGPEIPAPLVIPGFYISLGASAAHIQNKEWVYGNRTYTSIFGQTNVTTSNDFTVDNQNKLAPIADIGYWAPIGGSDWVWGVQALYKFLDFNSSGEAVLLPNASVAINTLTNSGYDIVLHERIKHEFMIFPYFGIQYDKGFAYLGIGPALLTIYNTLRINGIAATFNGTTQLYPLNLTVNNTVWGGAVELGYNYYFRPDWFMNFNYTYLVTAQQGFNSQTNQITVFPNDGLAVPTTPIYYNRNVRVTVQEVMWSINKVFAF